MFELIEQFKSHAITLGFHLDNVIPDENVHRFDRNGKKKNAWYVAYLGKLRKPRIAKDGSKTEEFLTVVMGDWRETDRSGMPVKHTYTSLQRMNAEEKSVYKQLIENSIKKKEQERIRCQQKAKIQATKDWLSSSEEGVSNFLYIKNKGLQGSFGAKLFESYQGKKLIIPAYNIAGEITSHQTIDENGEKRFLKDGELKGSFFTIGEITEDTKAIYICEGFSTGATINTATNQPVVCAFNSSNLATVTTLIANEYSDKNIIICGDDDKHLEQRTPPLPNSGRNSAETSAKIVGCSAIFPIFKSYEDDPSDFNDLLLREGIDAVKSQILPEDKTEIKDRTNDSGFVPLGYDARGKNYYYVNQTKQIIGISNYTDQQLYKLMPLERWHDKYKSANGKVSMEKARSDLIQISQQKGFFDVEKIRGVGSWTEDRGKTVVVNSGDGFVIVNGEKIGMGKWNEESEYYYVRTKKAFEIDEGQVKKEEVESLEKLLNRFNWSDVESPLLLLGWLFVSRIGGSLPIRPHIWLTGPKYSGKSTIMENLVSLLLPSNHYCQEGSTEAGIRQETQLDSVPVIHDEFEPSPSDKTNSEKNKILGLFRNSWSATKGKVYKGGADGVASTYNVSYCALLASINVFLHNDADITRFSVLELQEHKGSYEEGLKIKSEIDAISSTLGNRITSRAINKRSQLLDAFAMISSVLKTLERGREAEQVGMLFAGYWMLKNDEPPTFKDAYDLVNELMKKGFDFKKKETDEQQCFNKIVTSHINVIEMVPSGDSFRDFRCVKTIGQVIAEGDPFNNLPRHGIRLEGKKILVANRNVFLQNTVFRDSNWQSGTWANTLKRINFSSTKNNAIRFSDKISRVTVIEYESWVKEVCEDLIPHKTKLKTKTA